MRRGVSAASFWGVGTGQCAKFSALVVPPSGATLKARTASPLVCKWDYFSLFWVVGGRLACL